MHAQSYNGFVDIVRFNLITSDWWVLRSCASAAGHPSFDGTEGHTNGVTGDC
jgi:hypothetical protein